MKHYLDITLIPDAEANLGFLWHKVYQQIHLALVENKSPDNRSDIAASFPKYGDKGFPLGNVLRLFSETPTQLEQLDINKWLNRLSDYIHCRSIATTPETIDGYAYFKRKHFKSKTKVENENDKWATKLAIKLDQSKETVLAEINKRQYESEFKLPFVNMVSLSSNESLPFNERKQFKLFVEKELVIEPKPGNFSCYGLSSREPDKQATVPWFEK